MIVRGMIFVPNNEGYNKDGTYDKYRVRVGGTFRYVTPNQFMVKPSVPFKHGAPGKLTRWIPSHITPKNLRKKKLQARRLTKDYIQGRKDIYTRIKKRALIKKTSEKFNTTDLVSKKIIAADKAKKKEAQTLVHCQKMLTKVKLDSKRAKNAAHLAQATITKNKKASDEALDDLRHSMGQQVERTLKKNWGTFQVKLDLAKQSEALARSNLKDMSDAMQKEYLKYQKTLEALNLSEKSLKSEISLFNQSKKPNVKYLKTKEALRLSERALRDEVTLFNQSQEALELEVQKFNQLQNMPPVLGPHVDANFIPQRHIVTGQVSSGFAQIPPRKPHYTLGGLGRRRLVGTGAATAWDFLTTTFFEQQSGSYTGEFGGMRGLYLPPGRPPPARELIVDNHTNDDVNKWKRSIYNWIRKMNYTNEANPLRAGRIGLNQ